MLYLIYMRTNNNYSISYSKSYNGKRNYGNDIIIEIQKINLKLPVIKALNDFSNLDNNLVYYNEFNPLNKIVIFGHSGVGYGAFFNRIDELIKDDVISIYNKDKHYLYSVYDTKVVNKTSIYLLDEEINSKKLLLITCDKKNKNKRLVIYLLLNNIKSIEK